MPPPKASLGSESGDPSISAAATRRRWRPRKAPAPSGWRGAAEPARKGRQFCYDCGNRLRCNPKDSPARGEAL